MTFQCSKLMAFQCSKLMAFQCSKLMAFQCSKLMAFQCSMTGWDQCKHSLPAENQSNIRRLFIDHIDQAHYLDLMPGQ